MIHDDQSWDENVGLDKKLLEARAKLSTVNMDAVKLYLNKEYVKGVRWMKQDEDILFKELRNRVIWFESSMEELIKNPQPEVTKKCYDYLLDMINYAKMLGVRINQ